MMFLALRQLMARKKQSFAILFGVLLGTMIYVFISGTQLGFRQFIIEQLVENDAHLKVTAREEKITPTGVEKSLYGESDKVATLWAIPPSGRRHDEHLLHPGEWKRRLRLRPEVVAVSEQYSTQVFASRGGTKVGATLSGVIPSDQTKVSRIEKYLTRGRFSDLASGGQRVLVGEGLLEKLGARVSETVFLSTGLSEAKPFKIVGSFRLGVQQIDDALIYSSLTEAQQLAGASGRITQIAVRLTDASLARQVSESLSRPGEDRVQSWDQSNAGILDVFKIQDFFRIFMTGGILLVAAFGIYNVLSIMVNQKRREIAILRSLGYTPGEVMQLFLIQGLLLGSLGALAGLIFGYLLCRYIETVPINFGGRKGFVVAYDLSIYFTGLIAALVSAVLASWLPARAAGRMTPIDIIRSEAG